MTNPMTPNSPILGPTDPTATVAAAWAYVDSRDDLGPVINPENVHAYLRELHRLCLLSGIRFEIAVGQCSDECNVFRDRTFWGRFGNPVGFGAEETLDRPGDINYTGGSWTPVGAARVHLVHLWLYAAGTALPAALAPYKDLDTRWQKAIAAGFAGKAPTLAGLAGRWAVNPNYAVQIAAHANRAFPRLGTTPIPPKETPVATKIPSKPDRAKPTIYNLATDYARYDLEKWQADDILASKFTNRNGGRPEFIYLHVQEGITTGSLDYWSSDVIDASSTVMIQKDGSILRVIPEQDGPWTNGDVINPTAEAREILALGGNPNKWSLTVEGEGWHTEPLTPAQLDATVWQVETWIITYPDILDHVWSIGRHGHINSRDRWRCPDDDASNPQASNRFEPVVDAVNVWLESVEQPVPVPPVIPPEPETPEQPDNPFPKGMSEELAKRLYGRVTVPWSSKEFVFNLERSECQYWLARGQLNIPEGEDYTAGEWPELDDVIRRGATKEVHVYRWANGDVYEKVIRKDR